MATLREYFDTDISRIMNIAQDIEIGNSTIKQKVTVKMYMDFDSNSKFISIFIPTTKIHAMVCKGILLNINDFLKITRTVKP